MLQILSNKKISFVQPDLLSITKSGYIGKYQEVLDEIEIKNMSGELIIVFAKIDVYGNRNLSKVIQKSEDRLYILDNDKVNVLLEKMDDNHWLTIGKAKYKKII